MLVVYNVLSFYYVVLDSLTVQTCSLFLLCCIGFSNCSYMFSHFTMLYWNLSLFRQYGIFLFFILFLRFQDRILDPFQLFFFYFISKILILDVGPVQTEWYIFFHLISMILILNLFHCSESVIFSFFCVFFFLFLQF